MKGVFIFLADGFEDVEALGTGDVLRRGGVGAKYVSITGKPCVVSSHGVSVCADAVLSDLNPDDGAGADDFMIFPGGMPGSKALASSQALADMMQAHYDRGGSLAAICAAPGLVLARLRDVGGLHFTCFDSFEDALVERGCVFEPVPVVRCGRIITGRSAGYALDFGLEILKAIKGEAAAGKVREAMFLP